MNTFAKLLKHGRLASPMEWWDRWDFDIDYDSGFGNTSSQARYLEIRRAAHLLAESINTLESLGRKDVQVWLMLHLGDSREDRLYLHSKNNRNGTPWPMVFRSYLAPVAHLHIPGRLRVLDTVVPFAIRWFRAVGYPKLWYAVPEKMLGPVDLKYGFFRLVRLKSHDSVL